MSSFKQTKGIYLTVRSSNPLPGPRGGCCCSFREHKCWLASSAGCGFAASKLASAKSEKATQCWKTCTTALDGFLAAHALCSSPLSNQFKIVPPTNTCQGRQQSISSLITSSFCHPGFHSLFQPHTFLKLGPPMLGHDRLELQNVLWLERQFALQSPHMCKGIENTLDSSCPVLSIRWLL